MTDDEMWERADRMAELKKDLSDRLALVDVVALPWELENDIEVHGPLSVIMQFCQDHRSEIEELG